MRIEFVLFVLSLLLIMLGCKKEHSYPILEAKIIDVPTSSSGQSRLVKDHKGQAYLSWIEYDDSDTFRLQYAHLNKNDEWSAAQTIRKGNNWFINWADFPSLTIFNNGDLAAHWLQMRDTGTYQYDVAITTLNQRNNCKNAFILHHDGIAAEHGFVSMIPGENNKIIASWLDGRNTVSTDDVTSDEHSHSSGGAMTLRTASFNLDGELEDQVELDNRVCDCCQTDMAMTDKGPIVVYRDRSEQEIRDMSIVRKVKGIWTEPKTIHNDQWQVNGCPVNGPSVDARGRHVAVAWFTAAEGKPRVLVALSTDSGANFDLPIIIDDEDPIGRVDIKSYDKENFIVTWLTSGEDGQTNINCCFVDLSGNISKGQTLLQTSVKRKSGFPIIEKDKKGILLTWTSLDGSQSKIKTARLVETKH